MQKHFILLAIQLLQIKNFHWSGPAATGGSKVQLVAEGSAVYACTNAKRKANFRMALMFEANVYIATESFTQTWDAETIE